MGVSDFYQQCALTALQGILESNGKIGEVAEVLPPHLLAKRVFDIADAMENELNERKRKTLG